MVKRRPVVVRSFFADATVNGDRLRANSNLGPHNKARKRILDIVNQGSSALKIPRRRRNAKGEKRIPFVSVEMPLVASIDVSKKPCCVENKQKDLGIRLEPPATTVIPLADFKILDCPSEVKGIAVLGVEVRGDDTREKTFLCWKAPRRRGIGGKHWKEYRKTLKRAFELKPNVARGEGRSASNDRYICFGMRKNPKDSGIGTYAFKPPKDQNDLKRQKEITDSVGKLCHQLETVTSSFIKCLPDEGNLKTLQREHGLPRAFDDGAVDKVGYATQFSVGKNYWSKIHTDNDYFYTNLSCLSENPNDSNEVLYYFCFPTYNVAVPMKSGDILLFNPLVLHGCSNPMRKDVMIFSAYVSCKTANTVVANNADAAH